MAHTTVKPTVTYPASTQGSSIGSEVSKYIGMINTIIQDNPSLVKAIQPILGNESINAIIGKVNQYVNSLNNYVEESLNSLQSGSYSTAEATALNGINIVNRLYSLANGINLTSINLASNYREFADQLLNITYTYLSYVNSTLTYAYHEAKVLEANKVIEESVMIPSEVTWGKPLSVGGCVNGASGIAVVVIGDESVESRLSNGCFNASVGTLMLNPGAFNVKVMLNGSLIEVRRVTVTPGSVSRVNLNGVAIAGSTVSLRLSGGSGFIIEAPWGFRGWVNSSVVTIPVPLSTPTGSYVVNVYVKPSPISNGGLIRVKLTVINIIQLMILASSVPVAYALIKLRRRW